jgi:NADH:ubiquinone oxidoreductase subunit 6 (subunit J)
VVALVVMLGVPWVVVLRVVVLRVVLVVATVVVVVMMDVGAAHTSERPWGREERRPNG